MSSLPAEVCSHVANYAQMSEFIASDSRLVWRYSRSATTMDVKLYGVDAFSDILIFRMTHECGRWSTLTSDQGWYCVQSRETDDYRTYLPVSDAFIARILGGISSDDHWSRIGIFPAIIDHVKNMILTEISLMINFATLVVSFLPEDDTAVHEITRRFAPKWNHNACPPAEKSYRDSDHLEEHSTDTMLVIWTYIDDECLICVRNIFATRPLLEVSFDDIASRLGEPRRVHITDGEDDRDCDCDVPADTVCIEVQDYVLVVTDYECQSLDASVVFTTRDHARGKVELCQRDIARIKMTLEKLGVSNADSLRIINQLVSLPRYEYFMDLFNGSDRSGHCRVISRWS